MDKILVFLLVSSLFVSCSKSGGGGGSDSVATTTPVTDDSGTTPTPTPSSTPTPKPTPTPTPSTTPTPGTGLPNAAYTFDTDITFINTTVSQQNKFDLAIEMIKRVVATEEFRSSILNHTYGGKKTFVDNGGYTNAQIYQMILDGAEKLQTAKNNTMNMEVELYYAATTTVGYTYPNTKRIWVNTKYFNTNSVGKVAANLFHEWLHKVGFGHAVSYSTSRDYSVPYAVGRMITNIGAKL